VQKRIGMVSLVALALVVYLIWKDPWMSVGRETFIASMLAQAGMGSVIDAALPRYPALTLDQIARGWLTAQQEVGDRTEREDVERNAVAFIDDERLGSQVDLFVRVETLQQLIAEGHLGR